ncbi:MAG: extracellular solute-binding protein [Erysipelotrichaceae bacterium]|nr:extracellular solute-binding protein [Erysipelotrichaceae bacterium]
MKKLISLLLALLMVVSLSGCGGSSDSSTDGGEAAVGGGTLVIYSPNTEALCDVAYAFGEQYGIDVQVQSLGTGEALEKIVAETENPQADVLYGGVNYANAYKYADYFEQYTAAGDDKLPEAYQNTNGVATHYCLDGSAALLINIDRYTELGLNVDDFKGYADLLQPELQGAGMIAMGDPAKSSSAWAELTNMLAVMGNEPYDDAAWAWVESFIGQLGGIIDSSSAIWKGVVAGEYVVGVSYEDPCVKLLVDGADNVKLVYPEEGAVWLPAGAAIIKNAQNMDNAKLFMDWLVSDEGQAEIAKTTARPVNTAVSNTTDKMTPFADINVTYEDMALCGDNKSAWQEKWTALYTAAHPE